MKLLPSLFIMLFATAATDYHPKNSGVSGGNSTTTPLASGATFTGSWEECGKYDSVSSAVSTDLAGTLKMQFSPDGTNLDSSLSYNIAAGVIEPPHKLEIFRKYCRVTFTNDDASSTQSYLRLQTLYGSHSVPSAPMNLPIGQDADAIIARTITEEVGIAEGKMSGYSVVNKFGRNADVDTGDLPEDVWAGNAAYTGFPTGAAELVEVVSSHIDDDEGDPGCEKVRIYGLDDDGMMQDEEIILNGQTPVDSVSTYDRVFRALCTQSANGANTAFNLGIITVRHTTTTANVFLSIPVAASQSQVGCYTIPAGHTGYLRNFTTEVKRSNSATVDGALWVRPSGGPPRLINIFSAGQTSPFINKIYGGIKLLPLTDLCSRITGSSASNVSITSSFDIILVKN